MKLDRFSMFSTNLRFYALVPETVGGGYKYRGSSYRIDRSVFGGRLGSVYVRDPTRKNQNNEGSFNCRRRRLSRASPAIRNFSLAEDRAIVFKAINLETIFVRQKNEKKKYIYLCECTLV